MNDNEELEPVELSLTDEQLELLKLDAQRQGLSVDELTERVMALYLFCRLGQIDRDEDRPRWVRFSTALSRFGIGKDVLKLWTKEGKVEAHKVTPGKNGTVVFFADDIDKNIRLSPLYKCA